MTVTLPQLGFLSVKIYLGSVTFSSSLFWTDKQIIHFLGMYGLYPGPSLVIWLLQISGENARFMLTLVEVVWGEQVEL